MFEKEESLRFDLLKLLYLNSDSETLNYNICDSLQLVTKRDNSQSNPIHRSKLSVELAVPTIESHTLTSNKAKESCPMFAVQYE